MQLSIVIPAKNEAERLPALLRSFQKQKRITYEAIVADAHSTDDTRSLAAACGATVVDGGLPGPGRNAGARIATGDWICFHDADVTVLSETFYHDVLVQLEARKADFGTVRFVPDKNTFLFWLFHALYHWYSWLTSPWVAHAGGGCIFVRRSWHERVHGFDETVVFAEDMEYVQRLQKAGARFVYLGRIPLQASVRRLERDGLLTISWRYIYAEWYMRFRGPIRKELFEYDFSYPKKNV